MGRTACVNHRWSWLEILEVRDGQVQKARLSHVLDKAKTTLRLNLPDGTVPETIEEENGGLRRYSEMTPPSLTRNDPLR